ncbi:hypothetical protein [Desertimonas flava]|uniref:hypothetical protein n=1 Tax=Desertimonas flava TaxID=2064846 RepID=UPI000E352251|nr:hypothetical protein [Desertimonas flava]
MKTATATKKLRPEDHALTLDEYRAIEAADNGMPCPLDAEALDTARRKLAEHRTPGQALAVLPSMHY